MKNAPCVAFQDFAPRVLVMYVIAVLAFLFYVSKVPERYFPGRHGFRRGRALYSGGMVEVCMSEHQNCGFFSQYHWL